MAKIKDNTVQVVFISLLLDLLAFTVILPLLPSLLDYYKDIEHNEGLYFKILHYIQHARKLFDAPDKVSTVLYGGFLGSMYSFLQFLGSPIVGALSDIYGRKPLMLFCLTGITLSYLLWAVSFNFTIFVLARFIGGISKGNISLSIAIITDVTSPKTRGKAMALVGIAFSIGFVLGPMIGAFFAWTSTNNREGTWYIIPAIFALSLAASDLCFIICTLKESLPSNCRAKNLKTGISGAIAYINPVDLFQFNGVSGLNLQGIGLVMAILQGSWVRTIPPNKTKSAAELGLWLIIPAFVCIGIAKDIIILSIGILLFATSTAMVVTCMMTLVTRIGPENQKGVITGVFRSLGALARACGPIIASSAFWCIGSKITYLIGAIFLVFPPLILQSIKSL
ncbi:major facilitator superfamily domain-containing protein rtet isoform X2 [Ptiloglossa arizonensis]|uniref:major facilitator superfamily domain-containing protein rtet isoform X2 n=1 Tax=Ptiloglossa arizonensis TaxID=3350558 RepID=UPI003FA1600B